MTTRLAIPVDLDEGYRLAEAFLTPILNDTVEDAWAWDPQLGWRAGCA